MTDHDSTPQKKPKRLTSKQRKFIAVFDGSGLEAAKAAKYKGNDHTLAQVACENLKKPEIAAAIIARETTELRPGVVARRERQVFWSSQMLNEELDMTSRLRASELLGKSEGDFLNRVEIADTFDLAEIVRAARERAR